MVNLGGVAISRDQGLRTYVACLLRMRMFFSIERILSWFAPALLHDTGIPN